MFAAIAAMLAANAAAHAATVTVTLQQGLNSYAGTDDTSLIQSNADANYGIRSEILIGSLGTTGTERAGLIRFDTSSLAGLYQSIDSMKLRFWVVRTAGDNTYNVNLLRAGNAGWGEGSSNGVAESGAASWNYAQYNTLQWLGGMSGARLATDAYYGIGSFTLNTTDTPIGTMVEVNINPSSLATEVNTLTKIVDLWNSTANAGFQIYSGTVGGTNVQWGVASSENTTASYHPELVITYTTVPVTVPTPAALPAGLGLLTLTWLRRRRV